MSALTCLGCGRITNTTLCDWAKRPDRQPHKCFAAWEDGKWVKGCGYDEADEFEKHFADRIIGGEKEARE